MSEKLKARGCKLQFSGNIKLQLLYLPAKFQGAMIKNGDLISGKFGYTAGWILAYVYVLSNGAAKGVRS